MKRACFRVAQPFASQQGSVTTLALFVSCIVAVHEGPPTILTLVETCVQARRPISFPSLMLLHALNCQFVDREASSDEFFQDLEPHWIDCLL